MKFARNVFRRYNSIFILVFSVFSASYLFADSSVITPQDFFSQVLDAINGLGGLSWVLKVAAIVTVLVSSMKVTALNKLVWSKLGNFQAWVAPILGLIAGLLGIAGNGGITLARVFAYLSAGAGAIILHELLDTIKAIPGLGDVYVGIIDTIEKLLGGPASQKA